LCRLAGNCPLAQHNEVICSVPAPPCPALPRPAPPRAGRGRAGQGGAGRGRAGQGGAGRGSCRQPAPVDVAERSQQAAFAQLVVLEKISATFQKLSFGFLSSVVKINWVKNQKAITTKEKNS